MTSDNLIQSPYTLAELPHLPVDGSKGRYHVAEVWSGSKKRKRPEVAVGIDGKGVNIYDIQSPKLLASYALPPQSVLTCPPCSFRWKSKQSSSIRRATYVSVIEPRPQIICFSETCRNPSSRTGSFIDTETSIQRWDIDPSESQIVHLDVLTFSGGPISGLLIIHRNGSARCLSADLATEHWSTSVVAAPPTESNRENGPVEVTVEYATVTDANTAQKGLLRGRDDALSILLANAAPDSRRTPVLFLITRPAQDALPDRMGRSIHILSIPLSRSNDALSNQRRPQALVSYRLPTANAPISPELSKPNTHFTLYPSLGVLYQATGGLVNIYDLTGLVPNLSNQFLFGDSMEISVLRIAPRVLLTASSASINMYGIKHKSLQASLPILEDASISSSGKKRKLGAADSSFSTQAVTLISYFTDAGIAIGLVGRELIAFRVSLSSETAGGAKRRRNGLLIDAIGRGIDISTGPKDINGSAGDGRFADKHHPRSTPADEQHLKELVSSLDRCVERTDVENFEKIFAKEVGIKRNESDLVKWRQERDAWEKEQALRGESNAPISKLPNGLTEEISKATSARKVDDERPSKFSKERPLPRWRFPAKDKKLKHKDIDPSLVTYVIGKMFHWDDKTHQPLANGYALGEVASVSALRIIFYTPNVLHWLVESGNFSIAILEAVIHQNLQTFHALAKGDFVRCLVDFDPTMELLLYFLRSTVYLDIGELICSLRLLMRGIGFPATQPQSVNGLINGEDVEMTLGGNGDLAVALRLEEEAAERDLDFGLSALETGPIKQQDALSAVLARIHSFPPATIVKALREDLNADEILSVVQILRNELICGGWTSRYLDDEIEDETAKKKQNVNDGRLQLITDLLSYALDSSGPGGWLMGKNSIENPMDDLVSSLRSDISAALECVEESTYLTGLLREMVRYGNAALKTRIPKWQLLQKQKSQRPQTVKLELDLHDDKFLPLGLKPEQVVSRTRTGAGGEVKKRTARDRGHILSKSVPKYSFEKIRF